MRKEAQWISVFDTACQPAYMLPGDLCPNGGVLQLVTPPQLSAYEGSMRILRIRAHLRIGVAIPLNGRDCYGAFTQTTDSVLQARMGLKRGEYEGDPATASGLAFNPMDSRTSGFKPNEKTGDFADAPWMHLWDHSWFPTPELTSTIAPATCCSVVTQDSYTVPPWETALGNGSWPGVTVPPVTTECIPCDTSEAPLICGSNVRYPESWRWDFDWKRPIQMKDDHTLGLFFGWTYLKGDGTFTAADQPTLVILGNIKMLVES